MSHSVLVDTDIQNPDCLQAILGDEFATISKLQFLNKIKPHLYIEYGQ